jgi:ribosomal protein S18 acetylase RimI-like enzyme
MAISRLQRLELQVMTPIRYRQANSSDAALIGHLHADSWRRHYRGAYSDAYLDGEIDEERTVVWTERLSEVGADHFTIVAESDGLIVGFAHTRLDEDPSWGALLDNLHVSYELKRQGVGRVLMAETVRVLAVRRPTSRLYLWVLQQNTAAQAFYRAQGGVCVEETLGGPFPGGGRAPSLRYAWSNPSKLLND